ncbi:hypothetical protein RFI_18737 [Reticulomyxa filosa]|uniref:Ion transport domain-containing protein n=1 Tax=Reticulomyxa filosa TaxID=46433 RepID=X6MXI4_RETFI|nr:hypothetical protein RFI_18737 [Reticulomyxa filosa]|eukprot:ETO18529.1 hypothetical protein RFI_18737 [Reticulomyxa filosa]
MSCVLCVCVYVMSYPTTEYAMSWLQQWRSSILFFLFLFYKQLRKIRIKKCHNKKKKKKRTFDTGNDIEKARKDELTQRQNHEVLARKALRLSREKPNLYLQGKSEIIVTINRLVEHDYFNVLVTIVILANVAVLSMEWPGMSHYWSNICATLNLVFTLFFTVELILKLLGLGYVLCKKKKVYVNMYFACLFIFFFGGENTDRKHISATHGKSLIL